MAELGHSALPTSASICEADQLFLANVESISIALAAAVKGRRHGNRAVLRLWQIDGRPPLRGKRFRERGGLIASPDDNRCHGLRARVDDGHRPKWSFLFRLRLRSCRIRCG